MDPVATVDKEGVGPLIVEDLLIELVNGPGGGVIRLVVGDPSTPQGLNHLLCPYSRLLLTLSTRMTPPGFRSCTHRS